MVKKRVALYGAGSIVRERYFLFDDLFEIECCYDNDEKKWGGEICNTPIRKWERIRHIFIIITIHAWEKIALQLEKEGLELGKDYLPWYVYGDLNYLSLYCLRRDFLNGKYLSKEWEYTSFLPNKKLAVIYGNCQTGVYKNALALSRRFKEDYVIIKVPQIWEYDIHPEVVKFFLDDKGFWMAIKLFIYQFVSKMNSHFEGLATEYCIRKLGLNCKKVAIVSLDFRGYFPQIERGDKESVFGYRDKYIDALIGQKIDLNEIIDILSDEKFISDAEVESNIKNSFLSLKKRDDFADVKIYDYIERNYAKNQLFYSPFHPCDNLLKEYAQRIFNYLGLEWDITDDYFSGVCSGGIMRGFDVAIYPSVVKKIGLRKYENRFYFNREYDLENMILDFRQYIEIYIKHVIF